jgi:hypothetical protein
MATTRRDCTAWFAQWSMLTCRRLVRRLPTTSLRDARNPLPNSGLAVTAMFSVVLTACAGGRPPSSVSQRDSAGITILESTSPRWSSGEGWRIDATPLLDLTTSGTGPSHEFYRVRDAIRLPDGSIVVADRGSCEVRLFSATGEFVRAVGRRGEGPGEFERLTSIHRIRGDSLIAFDYWLRRITVLGPDLSVSRTFSLFADGLSISELNIVDDTTLVATTYSLANLEGVNGLFREKSPVITMSLIGGVLDTMTSIAGSESFEGPTFSAPTLFGKASHLAVHDGLIYLGSADQMQFEVFSPAGRQERIVRIPGVDLSVSSQEIQEERDALEGPDPSQMIREIFAAVPKPETRPAYSDLLVDSEGFVWAAEHLGEAQRGKPRGWRVFTSEGAWLGSVQTPGRFTVYEIGRDYVLGRLLDDMDVEHVQLLRLNH